jgi:hypothetical protein
MEVTCICPPSMTGTYHPRCTHCRRIVAPAARLLGLGRAIAYCTIHFIIIRITGSLHHFITKKIGASRPLFLIEAPTRPNNPRRGCWARRSTCTTTS